MAGARVLRVMAQVAMSSLTPPAMVEGMQANLVLLDAKQVIDRATYAQPHEISTGVRGVWVNGVQVWDGQNRSEKLAYRQ